MSIKSKIQSLIAAANTATGGSDATLTDAVQTLVDGYGQGGGEDYLVLRLSNAITQYSNPDLSTLMKSAFLSVTALHSVFLPNAIANGASCFSGCTGLRTAVIGGTINRYINLLFDGCTALEAVDVVKNQYITNNLAFQNCRALQTIILRSSQLVTCGGVDNFKGTPFASGGSGGTIYIKKALYDHLGDGSSLDYKAATNWSTVDGYGTITWAQIEGSIYETQYADGTPIT
jgi:hypothetical protein